MRPLVVTPKPEGQFDIKPLVGQISFVQKDSGEIPGALGDVTDPWDHVEAAMGLCIGGYYAGAKKAFAWLAQHQLPDGSWFAEYKNGQAVEKRRDANMTAYIAVGLLHYFMITNDKEFLSGLWPTVRKAVEFVLSLQAPTGEIYWAIDPQGRPDRMALLTGSSSIYKSLQCAATIARVLGEPSEAMRRAAEKIAHAVIHEPHRFNMTKSRYAMDWYYPILAGIITGPPAQRRIDRYWNKFVVEGLGVRCVSDAPWVTIAETSELVLTLASMGNMDAARIVFGWINDKRFADGTYWCGYTFPDSAIWPEEKMTWTNAAVLIAADAIFELTPAAGIFHHAHRKDGLLSAVVDTAPISTAPEE
jgi:hypothetical protein